MLRFCCTKGTFRLRIPAFSPLYTQNSMFFLKLILRFRVKGMRLYGCSSGLLIDRDLYSMVAGSAGGMGRGFGLCLGLSLTVGSADL